MVPQDLPPPPPEASAPIVLESLEELPSALDPVNEGGRRLARGRWKVRPLFAVTLLSPPDAVVRGTGVRFGVSGGRQWWGLKSGAVQWGGSVTSDLQVSVGGVGGYDATLRADAGPWLGPVGLQVGVGLRGDRTVWRRIDGVLPAALFVTPRATLGLDLGRLRPMVGVEPSFRLVGDRPSVTDAQLARFGDETSWFAGISVRSRPVSVLVRGMVRETALGLEVDVGVGLGLSLL